MKLALSVSLLLPSTIAASSLQKRATCGTHGNPPIGFSGPDPTLLTLYDCGVRCDITTICNGFAVGPGGGYIFTITSPANWVANASSPIRYFDRGQCDYKAELPTPVVNPAYKGTCEVNGWTNGNSIAYWSSPDPVDATLRGCYAKCIRNYGGSSCGAFAYGGGQCLLFTSTAIAADMVADPGSPNIFADMACFNGTVIPASTTLGDSPAAAPTSTSLASSSASVSTAKASTSVATSTIIPSAKASTSTTTSTSNAATATPSTSASNICEQAGWDKQNPASYSSPSAASAATCQTACKNDSKCKAYAFGNKACLLYTSPLANNLTPDAGSPYVFSDLACSATTAPAAAGKTCKLQGVERDSASASAIAAKFRPSQGCAGFCSGKSAVAYEVYYEYCFCFSANATSVATAETAGAGVFSDSGC